MSKEDLKNENLYDQYLELIDEKVSSKKDKLLKERLSEEEFLDEVVDMSGIPLTE